MPVEYLSYKSKNDAGEEEAASEKVADEDSWRRIYEKVILFNFNLLYRIQNK